MLKSAKDWAMIPTAVPTRDGGREAIYGYGWYAQVKVDGVRIKLTMFQNGDLALIGKNGSAFIDYGGKTPMGWTQPPLKPCVMDGELVRKNSTFYPFDLLEVENVSLVRAPHHIRMKMLADIVPEPDHCRMLRTYDPKLVWAGVLAMEGEGMVVKDPESPYIVGPSRLWLKVKNMHHTAAQVTEVYPDKNGVTVVVVHPITGELLGKVHTTVPYRLNPGDLVTIRYCQTYPDGRLREMYLVPADRTGS